MGNWFPVSVVSKNTGDIMETWKQLVGERSFISDLGKSHEAEIGGMKTEVGRYAVWVPVPGSGRHQVVEIGDDLNRLLEKYSISADMVLKLGAFSE